MLRTGLAACMVVLLLAACGGARPHQAAPPKLPRALAQRWASEADNVAAAVEANDSCGARTLARSLAASVDADTNRIPARFRSLLITAAATLADRISCVPTPPTGPKPPKGPHGHDKPKPGKGKGQGDGG